MRKGRAWAGVALALFLGCGGSGKPAKAPEDLTMEDVARQTRAACEELQGCDLIDEGQASLEDCISRGLYTVDSGTRGCVGTYWEFEACVADLGCGDLATLFKNADESAPCRKQAHSVQQECNVNVL